MKRAFYRQAGPFLRHSSFSYRSKTAIALVVVSTCLILGASRAPGQKAVCNGGIGRFQSTFETGVTATVDAVPSGGFATRSCEAVLSWKDGRILAVPSAGQIEIDVLGADLGFGVPVIAFEVRESELEWRSSYEIWTLQKQPRLLTTLTGGDFYRAVDAELNGYVTIWTTDASAVEGFDGLTYSDYASPPTVVLRFEHGNLLDVSAWYRAEYDAQIKELRSTLTSRTLADFKKSDGRLAFGSLPASSWIQLREAKAAVLGIVWAYLYSGRPDRAWAELEGAWPPSDEARVQGAIAAARARGIDSQVKTIASPSLPAKWNDASFVYSHRRPESTSEEAEVASASSYWGPEMAHPGGLGEQDTPHTPRELAVDTVPRPISMWRPPPSESEALQIMQSEETVELIIDEAGKVWSARMISPKSVPRLVSAAGGWKFIPARKDGKPVAFLSKMVVNPYR